MIAWRIDPQDNDALAEVRALLTEAERTDGGPAFSDQAMLGAAASRREIWGFGGDPAAGLQAAGVLGEGELDLVVHPNARGRGLGTRALQALLSHDATRPGGPAQALTTWVHGDQPQASQLLLSAGFAPVRSLYRLALDPSLLAQAQQSARRLPAGVTVRPFHPHHSADASDWVRVNAAAFASHPEQGRMSIEDFMALTREAWFDPHDLQLAFEGSDLVGFTWVKTTGDAPRGVETELYVLGVDPAHTGRGLGAALLGVTLDRMAEHHPARITLYVDEDNARARELYRRAGFHIDRVSSQWIRTGSAG